MPGEKNFIIQKVFGKGLYWDILLEISGVLKCFRLTSEPMSDSKRRTAIKLKNRDISEGEYVGERNVGDVKETVRLWDKGTFDLTDSMSFKLDLRFYGKKISGSFILVQIKDDEWMFFKA